MPRAPRESSPRHPWSGTTGGCGPRLGQGPARGLIGGLRSLILGKPIASARQLHERLSKVKALAVLSSDPLSSVAYATEQTLAVLLLAGAGAISFSLPIGAAIVVLLLIVGLSYRQTIKAYPNGGGSYIVAKDNLGPVAGLAAAAALTTDYVLTVSVSVSAGVQAVTSAAPELVPFTVELGLAVIGLMVLVNLRGVREAGTIFAAPTYLFILAMVALLIAGGVRLVLAGPHNPIEHQTNYPTAIGLEGLTLFLILKAFSSGLHRADGGGGHLQRRSDLQAARVAQRADHPDGHGGPGGRPVWGRHPAGPRL